MTWWAAQVHARSEEQVYHKLVNGGYKVFWPHVSAWVTTGHKAKSRLLRRSWLTGYLFVETEKDNLWAVNEVPGVASIVRGACNGPGPIPASWVEELMSRCDQGGEVHKSTKVPRRNRFRTGDRVKITDETSPLLGVIVEITKALDNGSICATFYSELLGRVTIKDPRGDVIEGAP